MRKIRAHVEMGGEYIEEVFDLPEDWDVKTEKERDEYLAEMAVELQNNKAPCGAEVIEVEEG